MWLLLAWLAMLTVERIPVFKQYNSPTAAVINVNADTRVSAKVAGEAWDARCPLPEYAVQEPLLIGPLTSQLASQAPVAIMCAST
jgi:hypothetical protein